MNKVDFGRWKLVMSMSIARNLYPGVMKMPVQLCGCDALCAAEYARECGELLPAYDELMLTVSLLPKLNAVLQAGGLSPVPVTRPFWCRQGDSFELIGLCNGKPWRESPGNGGVLLKFP